MLIEYKHALSPSWLPFPFHGFKWYFFQECDEPEEFLSLEEKDAKAKEVTLGRILTDADFKKIDAAQLRKQV